MLRVHDGCLKREKVRASEWAMKLRGCFDFDGGSGLLLENVAVQNPVYYVDYDSPNDSVEDADGQQCDWYAAYQVV